MSDLPASREEAASLGAKRYSGMPCRRCGSPERYMSSDQCCACTAARVQTRRIAKGRRSQRHWPAAVPVARAPEPGLPVAQSDFIQPLTLRQLMGRRA